MLAYRRFGASLTIAGIDAVINAIGVMEDREELHHAHVRASAGGQAFAVLEHVAPVRQTVDAVKAALVLVRDGAQHVRRVQRVLLGSVPGGHGTANVYM
ncbi:hypothetical protein GF314_10370 [bacterium]|nr:hypothetical protein [bacterium]